jgi:hypothetical protein
MAEPDRAPDWHIWRHAPLVKLWEAVALSLNVEPRKVRHSPHSWMCDSHLFEEGQEFEDRLFLAERSFRRTLDADTETNLPAFIAWAGSKGWELPSELVTLAKPDDAADQQSDAPREANAPVYRTGFAGRPTSWRLIEAECRRRYDAGERYPNTRTKLESPAEWARVLIAWLKEKHREAPLPTEKTLASNKLLALLRELQSKNPKS